MPSDDVFYLRAALHVELALCLEAARRGVDTRDWRERIIARLREVCDA